MHRMAKITGVVLVAGLMVLTAAACSDDDEDPAESVATASQEVCDAGAAYVTAVEGLGTTLRTQGVTVDQAEDAVSDVESAKSDFDDAATDLVETEKTAIAEGFDSLQSSIEDIDGDDTLQTAAGSIAADVDTFKASIESANSSLGC